MDSAGMKNKNLDRVSIKTDMFTRENMLLNPSKSASSTNYIVETALKICRDSSTVSVANIPRQLGSDFE